MVDERVKGASPEEVRKITDLEYWLKSWDQKAAKARMSQAGISSVDLLSAPFFVRRTGLKSVKSSDRYAYALAFEVSDSGELQLSLHHELFDEPGKAGGTITVKRSPRGGWWSGEPKPDVAPYCTDSQLAGYLVRNRFGLSRLQGIFDHFTKPKA